MSTVFPSPDTWNANLLHSQPFSEFQQPYLESAIIVGKGTSAAQEAGLGVSLRAGELNRYSILSGNFRTSYGVMSTVLLCSLRVEK